MGSLSSFRGFEPSWRASRGVVCHAAPCGGLFPPSSSLRRSYSKDEGVASFRMHRNVNDIPSLSILFDWFLSLVQVELHVMFLLCRSLKLSKVLAIWAVDKLCLKLLRHTHTKSCCVSFCGQTKVRL